MTVNKPVDFLILAGSASIHTWRYLKGIAGYVHHILFISNKPVPDQYRPVNVRDTLLVNFETSAIWHTPNQIRAWLKKHLADRSIRAVIHTHQANSVSWHILRGTKSFDIPKVLTCWGSDILLLPQRGVLWKKMVRSNLRNADWITADAYHLAYEIQQITPLDKKPISVLNFGIEGLPKQMDVTQKPLQILSCRLHKSLYRIDLIIHVWAELEKEYPQWHLIIAASGEQTATLQELVESLNIKTITFTGFVSQAELSELYDHSRIFVSIPCSDATSISLLEALSHGCIPLLSNLPANHEWVIDDMNGYITENDSIETLISTLRKTIAAASQDVRLHDIAQFNHRLIERKGLHQSAMQHFANIYTQLLTNPEPIKPSSHR